MMLRGARMLAAVLLLSVVACTATGPDIENPKAGEDRAINGVRTPKDEETVRGAQDPPLVTLQLPKNMRATNLRRADDLPSTASIGSTNLNNVPVGAALQAVMVDTEIPLLWESQELQSRPVTLMNLKGKLPNVTSRICRAAHLLCAYRNGALEVMEKDTFVTALPGVAGTFSESGAGSVKSTIATSIGTLIKGTAEVDENGGNLIYTTDADGFERVQAYLEELRNGRPLIVMQLYIWQVTLNNARQLGINWTQFTPPGFTGLGEVGRATASTAVQSVTEGSGITIGAVFSGIVDANTVVKFLGTQGKVQNVSSPQLTFVSGTSATFDIGGTQRYVAQVGTLLSTTVAGTSSTAGASNNTVSTEELKTGLTININGTYEGGVVFSTLQLKTTDLIRFEPVATSGTTLQLPVTSDRKVQTVLRVRPGDNLVLAGLRTTRDTRNREGFPIPFLDDALPLSGLNQVENTELVILVKPSVVFFNDRDTVDIHSIKAEDQEIPKLTAKEVVTAPAPPPPAITLEEKPIARPSELQDELGTVTKLYTDTATPVATPATAPPAQPRRVPKVDTREPVALDGRRERIVPPGDPLMGGTQ